MDRSRVLLGASALLNIVLVFVVAWAVAKTPSASQNFVQVSTQEVVRATKTHVITTNKVDWRHVESPDYKKYIANLRSIGCPEETIRDIIIADVNKMFASRAASLKPTQQFKFWQASTAPFKGFDDEWQKQQTNLAGEKKALLKELLGIEVEEGAFGSDAVHAFSEILNFLPADKQQKVAEIETTFTARNLRRFGGRPTVSNWPEIKTLQDEKTAELAKILTPAEMEEYDLRLSRTAQNIRSNLGEFEPTELEFRTIFKFRKQFEDEFGPFYSPSTYAGENPQAAVKRRAAVEEMNDRTKLLIGPERFADYEHEREYSISSLKGLAEQHNIPKETIFQAFDAREYATAAAKNLQKDPALSEEQRKEGLKKIREDAERSYKTLLGTEAFEAYMRQSGRWLQEISPRN